MQYNHGHAGDFTPLRYNVFSPNETCVANQRQQSRTRSFRWIVLCSHASLYRTRRTTFNDCFGLDKKEGILFHRKRSSNLFSLSLSLSLSF